MTQFNPSRSSLRKAVSALALFTPLFVGRIALAQQACGDTTCPKGFVCEMEPLGCPAIDCAEGADCKPCVPATAAVCRPGPCSTDSNCADGMACADVSSTNCTGAAPTPPCDGGDCPAKPPADDTCSTTVSKQCLPRWAVECAVDADCGAGFKCEEQESCSCSGSSGSGSSGSGTATPGSGASPPSGTGGASSAEPAPIPTPDPARASGGAASTGGAGGGAGIAAPVPPDCTCAPSGHKICEAIQVACETDAQCSPNWTCRDNPAGSCWADSNGNRGCTPADPAKLCFPPFYDLSDAGGGTVVTPTNGSAPPTKGDSGSIPESATPSASAGGGCTIGKRSATSAGDLLAWGLALGAALGLSRRARRRS